MKTRYLLKRRGPKGGTHPIYVALYGGDLTEIIYTGHRIALKEWSKDDHLPKDHNGEIYEAIEKVKSAVNLAVLKLKASEQPVTPFTTKQAYEDLIKEKGDSQTSKDKTAKAGLKTISSLATQWTENNLFHFQASTQKTVKESINQFTEYLKIAGHSGLERKDLNEEVINKYARYLLEKKKLANSTHGKRIKHLRWFLKSLKYDVQGIKIRTGKTKIIVLTMDELHALEKVDVSHDELMQKAKDMYLLGCYTGQRISDIKTFNPTNTAGGFINITSKKSKVEVKIPIAKTVEEILIRYGNRSPKITEQDVNTKIKEACKKAGITQAIEIETTKGGQTITTTGAKYKEITMHTSGKTFISTVAREIYKLTPAETAGLVGKSLKTLLSHYFNLPAEAGRQKMIEVESQAQMKITA